MSALWHKCKIAELRAEHDETDCKHIHNDDSPIARKVFGWIPQDLGSLLSVVYVSVYISPRSASVSPETTEADGGDGDTCLDCCCC